MAKRKRAAREAIIDKTLHKKLLIDIEQHEHHKKTGVHLGGPEGVKFLLHKLGYKHTIENVWWTKLIHTKGQITIGKS